jgi:hypothetical protein
LSRPPGSVTVKRAGPLPARGRRVLKKRTRSVDSVSDRFGNAGIPAVVKP